MNTTSGEPIDYSGGCPACSQSRVTCEEVEEHFDYGTGTDRLSIVAKIPVLTCANCGFSFTNEVAEERRHEAVCRALGVLTSFEVKLTRERLGLSQADFSSLSGIGKASLGRWERGSLIQNESSDNLLRLLAYPENLQRLRDKILRQQGSAPTNVLPITSKFRALRQEDETRLRERAASFRLYG